MNRVDEIIVKSIRAALTGIGNIEASEEETENAIRKAKEHGIGALVCFGLEKSGLSSNRTSSVISSEIRRHILFDGERIRMDGVLSENGVDHMFLKGSVIQDIYPESYLRHMTDTDILIRESDREKVRDIMVNECYSVEVYEKTEEDVYYKAPVFDYEMHVALFHENIGNDWYIIYGDVWDKLIPDDDDPHRYHFDDKDMYVYLMAHAMKHFSNSGTGIKTLVDIYMIEKHYGLLSDVYVMGELKKLGLEGTVPVFISAVNKLFTMDDPMFTEDEEAVIGKVFASSQHGTRKEYMQLKLTDRGAHEVTFRAKIRYFFGRVFPPVSALDIKYPVLSKHPWLYPAVALWRLIKQPFRDNGDVIRELKRLKKM